MSDEEKWAKELQELHTVFCLLIIFMILVVLDVGLIAQSRELTEVRNQTPVTSVVLGGQHW